MQVLGIVEPVVAREEAEAVRDREDLMVVPALQTVGVLDLETLDLETVCSQDNPGREPKRMKAILMDQMGILMKKERGILGGNEQLYVRGICFLIRGHD